MELIQTKTERDSQLFKSVSPKEYGFFVRQSETTFEAGNHAQENTFETFKQGKANPKLCWLISVEPLALNNFLKTWNAVYIHVECVCVPEGSTDTIETINEQIGKIFEKELTPIQLMQREIERMKEDNIRLQSELEEKKIIKQKSK